MDIIEQGYLKRFYFKTIFVGDFCFYSPNLIKKKKVPCLLESESTDVKIKKVKTEISKYEKEMKKLQSAIRGDHKMPPQKYCVLCCKLFSSVTVFATHQLSHRKEQLVVRCKLCSKELNPGKFSNVESHFKKQHKSDEKVAEKVKWIIRGLTDKDDEEEHEDEHEKVTLENLEFIDESESEEDDKSEDISENEEDMEAGTELTNVLASIEEISDDEYDEGKFDKIQKKMWGN